MTEDFQRIRSKILNLKDRGKNTATEIRSLFTEFLNQLTGTTIELKSTISGNTDLTTSHLGGINEVSGVSSDVIITINSVTAEAFPIGTIVRFKRTSPDYDIIISQGEGSTVTNTRTYQNHQVINMWHKSLNVWEVLNPQLMVYFII
jgi:hypothetical protein